MLQQQLGPKIKDTSLELMKKYIFICTCVQHKASIHSPMWKLKQNKCTQMFQKKETHHKSDDLNPTNQGNPRAYLFLPC